MSSAGVVAAGAPATTDICLQVLRRGGNAVDAAVAGGFALAVTEPGLGTPGGGGFLMLRDRDGSTRLIDFFAAVPRSRPHAAHRTVTVAFSGTLQDFHVGPATVAVPGALDGLLYAHDRYGRLPLGDVLTPVRDLAHRGVPLAPVQAHVMTLIGEVLTLTPEAASVFAPHGRLLRSGERLVNRPYADFLSEVAAGRVRRLPAVGPLDAQDLAAYQVVEREPLRVDLARGVLWTNPEPSLGGPIIAHALQELDPRRGERVNPVALARALVDATAWHKSAAITSVRGTTHVSVAAAGQTVAMTVSNGSGSGVMLGDTGVLLNNMMGETDLHPEGSVPVVGQRIRSMMAPSLLDLADGPTFAMGTGGSERIRSAMVRVVDDLLRGAGLAEAVLAGRVHVDNQGTVHAEPGLAEQDVRGLAAVGPVSLWSDRDFYFGGVQAVATDATAVADPRRGGTTGRTGPQ